MNPDEIDAQTKRLRKGESILFRGCAPSGGLEKAIDDLPRLTGLTYLNRVVIEVAMDYMESYGFDGFKTRQFTAEYVKTRMRRKSALANKPAKAQNVSNPETQGTT